MSDDTNPTEGISDELWDHLDQVPVSNHYTPQEPSGISDELWDHLDQVPVSNHYTPQEDSTSDDEFADLRARMSHLQDLVQLLLAREPAHSPLGAKAEAPTEDVSQSTSIRQYQMLGTIPGRTAIAISGLGGTSGSPVFSSWASSAPRSFTMHADDSCQYTTFGYEYNPFGYDGRLDEWVSRAYDLLVALRTAAPLQGYFSGSLARHNIIAPNRDVDCVIILDQFGDQEEVHPHALAIARLTLDTQCRTVLTAQADEYPIETFGIKHIPQRFVGEFALVEGDRQETTPISMSGPSTRGNPRERWR